MSTIFRLRNWYQGNQTLNQAKNIFFINNFFLAGSKKSHIKTQSQCIWSVTAPQDQKIQLNFVDLNLPGENGNCRNQFLAIRNHDNSLEVKVCGVNPGLLI